MSHLQRVSLEFCITFPLKYEAVKLPKSKYILTLRRQFFLCIIMYFSRTFFFIFTSHSTKILTNIIEVLLSTISKNTKVFSFSILFFNKYPFLKVIHYVHFMHMRASLVLNNPLFYGTIYFLHFFYSECISKRAICLLC